ncbi:PREDICTED: uncharacterized protein LOC109177699 [Ipomoea nil]|uniref:uncharacterized protein LOC109177699 n=1 Tax=Ipomoea nil TaxID=35883 RepID=UPI000900E9C4|nr:PREDICTED: uncharacterized protein LOC109177699 [Ipomoea nil]
MRSLAFKLKQLKLFLRTWNKEVFGNVFDQVRSLESRVVSDVECKYADSRMAENRTVLHSLQVELLLALKQEECFWRQKARVKWLKEGDANTRFFHSVVKDRASPTMNQYNQDTDALLQSLPLNLVATEEAALVEPVSQEGVKSTVWKLDPDSVAGLDGFSGSFFRHCWDLAKDDVNNAVQDFFARVPVPRALASAQRYIDKKCRGLNIVVKLDMIKVSWPYLRAVLLKLGFMVSFTNIIMNNLGASRLFVLVNGVSCGFFQPTRGIKQRDSLSPLLFILASEALSRSIILKMGVGLLSPYSSSPGCPLITHLAFADDIIIFVNGASRTAANMSRILGMQRSSLPFRYQGVNLFKGRNRPFYYQHLIEKINGKLLGWQCKLLSSGGRLTLVKHVLSAIPLYTTVSVLLPRGTVKTIESRFANFLWGGGKRQTEEALGILG